MVRPRRGWLLLLACWLGGSSASAQSYWLVESGATLTRENGSLTTVEHASGHVVHTIVSGNCTVWESYDIADDGDVGYAGMTVFCTGAIDPDGYTLVPPLTLVDQPLIPGKIWSQQSTLVPMYGWTTYPVWVEGLVHGPSQVTVPAGTFDVVVVRVQITSIWYQLPSETIILLLQANLGDVTGLVAWSGVVPSEDATWSDVKALFR